MKTLEGIYKNGKIQLTEKPALSENQPVYVLIPDDPRQIGITQERNTRINEAKQSARARIRKRRKAGGTGCPTD